MKQDITVVKNAPCSKSIQVTKILKKLNDGRLWCPLAQPFGWKGSIIKRSVKVNFGQNNELPVIVCTANSKKM